MKRLILLGVALAALTVLAAGLTVAYVQRWAQTPLALFNQTVHIEVAPGTSLTDLARNLTDKNVIQHPRLFILYARYRDAAQRIKAGEYEVLNGTTPASLLEQLVDGRVILHAVTLVEGWDFRQVRDVLASQSAIKPTLTGTSEEVMAGLGLNAVHPEGRFFPDTYRFPKGTTDRELLLQAYALMETRLAEAWAGRSGNLPLQTPNEALILASIVEKETGLDSERPKIAGVFINRLQRGMALQSDPTVIYGLGESFDGDIRRRDLESDSPYNTYTRRGLPPTPIAMPGLASIQAVLHPEIGTALYFVATGDPDGSHYFSATLEEHNEAVQRYLDKLKSNR